MGGGGEKVRREKKSAASKCGGEIFSSIFLLAVRAEGQQAQAPANIREILSRINIERPIITLGSCGEEGGGDYLSINIPIFS